MKILKKLLQHSALKESLNPTCKVECFGVSNSFENGKWKISSSEGNVRFFHILHVVITHLSDMYNSGLWLSYVS